MAITGFDPATNFAIANLASGIAAAGTSMVLATGKGALFAQPSTDGAFNGAIYNSTDYASPWSDPSIEIVRCTARTTDTLTITRAQEGTADVSHNTGGKTYSFYATFTKAAYDALVTELIAVRSVSKGGTGVATLTAYAPVFGGTTGTGAIQSGTVGTAGQVFTSNGPGALPTFQAAAGSSVPPSSIPCDEAIFNFDYSSYTDDANYVPIVVSGSNVRLYAFGISAATHRINNGVTQTVAHTAIWAAAAAIRGFLVVGGFMYVYLRNSPVTEYRLYRCAVTSDIATGANWTQITLSGAQIAGTSVKTLIGYGNSSFWFADGDNLKLFPATLSGTTLTQGTDVLVTGMSYTSASSLVNDTGIFAKFAAGALVRFASFAGTLSNYQQFPGVVSATLIGVGTAAYMPSGAGGYTAGSDRHFIKIK